MAKDTELNRWVSLNKALALKSEQNADKRYDKVYEKKAKNENVKKRIFPSLYSEYVLLA